MTPLPKHLLEWLEPRVVEIDHCWVWQLSLNHGYNPQARVAGKTVKVRRVIWEATHTQEIQRNSVITVPQTCACGCVNPQHLKMRPRKQLLAGRVMPLSQRARISKTMRRKGVDAAAIRASEEGAPTLSKKTGISATYIGQIRRNERLRDFSNPFHGLMT